MKKNKKKILNKIQKFIIGIEIIILFYHNILFIYNTNYNYLIFKSNKL